MKAHRFRLARVLELKRRLEENQLTELARHEQTRVREEERLQALQAQRQAQQRRIAARGQGGRVEIERERREREFLDALERHIVQQESVVAHATRRCEEARAVYHERRREREALENLEARSHEEWVRESLREEQKLLDETGIRNHRRRMKIET